MKTGTDYCDEPNLQIRLNKQVLEIKILYVPKRQDKNQNRKSKIVNLKS